MNSRISSPLFAAALLSLATLASAAKGPEHKTLRPLAMGNAFVAVADDKDALYYNPAGLNLINRLGNVNRRPALANYPRNRFDARINALGMAAPVQDYGPFWRFFDDHAGSFGSVDDVKADTTMRADMAEIDGRGIPINVMNGAEFAMNNYGGAYWLNAQITPVLHANPFLPTPEVRDVTVDAVVQLAASHSFLKERLAVGLGYRLVNRQQVRQIAVTSDQVSTDSARSQLQDDLIDTAQNAFSSLTDFNTYGHGVDLGLLWQQNRWLRVGAAVQGVGLYLNHEAITPKITVGFAVSPPMLSSGGIFARKVNIAVDMEDLLNDDKNYKALSKLNFGAELEQYGWHFFSVRVAGGFKGGYWTAGGGVSLFDLVHLDAVSWAEEGGYYTGQKEDRLYAFNVGLGF